MPEIPSSALKINYNTIDINLKNIQFHYTYEKIEVIIRPEFRDKAVSAIKKIGVGGITVHHVQGQGSADPPLVGQYFSKDMIICVIDDPKLDDILNAIANVACTGTKGDGKVFVTSVEDALDICTKKRGTTSI